MPLFGRRRAGGSGEEPDETFGYLTADEAAAVRSLVRSAFAENGLEVVVHSDHVVATDGGQYGLANIAALCHTLPRKDWPAAAQRHVASVLRAVATPVPEDLPADEVLSRVFVRVMGTASLSDLSRLSYRRDLGGDLVELLALDYEDHVVLLDDEALERFDVDAVRHAGVANLLAEPFGTYETVKADRKACFGVVLGESVYTASRLLTMDDVLRRTIGDVDAPDGIFVCVPTRHQLAFHVLRDPAAIPVLESMAVFAATGYADGVGAVSPFLYWLQGGRFTPLTRIEGSEVHVDLDPALAGVLDRLANGR